GCRGPSWARWMRPWTISKSWSGRTKGVKLVPTLSVGTRWGTLCVPAPGSLARRSVEMCVPTLREGDRTREENASGPLAAGWLSRGGGVPRGLGRDGLLSPRQQHGLLPLFRERPPGILPPARLV